MVKLFSDKHYIFNVNENLRQQLYGALQYFRKWNKSAVTPKVFLSHKSWFDLQFVILGFISLVRTKLARFPGSMFKPAIVNQDVVENYFSQLRVSNRQHDNPTIKWYKAQKLCRISPNDN